MALASALGAGASMAAAQPTSDAAVFMAMAREATARFQQQSVAVAAGYRPVGPDSPGMGQHYVQPELVFAARLDAARPAILTYIQVQGRPVLAGVAYALPARGSNDLPEWPVGRAAWHFHGGTVDEEAFLPTHAHADPQASRDMSMAVLHLWLGVPNPESAWAADNWALPFARVGIATARAPSVPAANALSLVTVGEAFHVRAMRLRIRPDSASERALAPIVARSAGAVRAWLDARGTATVSAAELDWLAGRWAELWHEVHGAVSAVAWQRLAPLRGGLSAMLH